MIENNDDFAALKEDWQDLTARSGASIFQSWTWCRHWWRTFGSGKRLAIITVSNKDRVIGLLPLFISRGYLGLPLRIAALIGTGSLDYGGVPVDPAADGEKVLGAMIDCLNSQKWDVIDLHQLTADDVFYRLKNHVFFQTGSGVEEYIQETTFKTLLPASPGDYAASLSKKFRDNIEYNWRRINKDHRVEVDINCDPVDGLDDLYRLHRARWRKKSLPGVLYSEKARRFHRLIAADLFPENNLILSFLSIDGTRVAGLYGFKLNDTAYYYLGGFDPGWGNRSVSSLLLYRLISGVIEDGFRVFDFLRGEESYKDKWLAKPQPTYRLIVSKKSTRSDLAKKILARENQLILRAKKALHNKKIT